MSKHHLGRKASRRQRRNLSIMMDARRRLRVDPAQQNKHRARRRHLLEELRSLDSETYDRF